MNHLDHADADRLALLDRIHDRMPDLQLADHVVEWRTLPDGSEALVVDGGGLDGGGGWFFANHGYDVHCVGSMQPLAPMVAAS